MPSSLSRSRWRLGEVPAVGTRAPVSRLAMRARDAVESRMHERADEFVRGDRFRQAVAGLPGPVDLNRIAKQLRQVWLGTMSRFVHGGCSSGFGKVQAGRLEGQPALPMVVSSPWRWLHGAALDRAVREIHARRERW